MRDSTYVPDGLLHHESDLRIEEHYTDTAGFREHVFTPARLPKIEQIHKLTEIPKTTVSRILRTYAATCHVTAVDTGYYLLAWD